MTTTWLIDDKSVVHAAYCANKSSEGTTYIATRVVRDDQGKPRLDIVHDYQEMSVHLAGPDQANGLSSSSGKPAIHPCPMCIPAEANA